ncbi:hypothetical protein [Humidisolicoccus flavus]|uniref:hypothetical protein n=1 Tax=Humidisolicoccus flavus TaxID=3111414 RepID=UPI003245EA69
MAALLRFATPDVRRDLATLLGRSARLGIEAVRVTLVGELALVTVPVLTTTGLLDRGPTILAARTFSMQGSDSEDTVVPVQAFEDALVDPEAEVELPSMTAVIPPWAAIAPPRSGWSHIGDLDPAVLASEASAVLSEVANALPANPGEAVVQSTRKTIWSADFPDSLGLPRGAAFALEVLGFLSQERAVRVTSASRWLRASSAFGEVLVKH